MATVLTTKKHERISKKNHLKVSKSRQLPKKTEQDLKMLEKKLCVCVLFCQERQSKRFKYILCLYIL